MLLPEVHLDDSLAGGLWTGLPTHWHEQVLPEEPLESCLETLVEGHLVVELALFVGSLELLVALLVESVQVVQVVPLVDECLGDVFGSLELQLGAHYSLAVVLQVSIHPEESHRVPDSLDIHGEPNGQLEYPVFPLLGNVSQLLGTLVVVNLLVVLQEHFAMLPYLLGLLYHLSVGGHALLSEA